MADNLAVDTPPASISALPAIEHEKKLINIVI